VLSCSASSCRYQRPTLPISVVDPAYNVGVHLSIEIDREDDGRWIAEALELPGVMAYGATREEAISNTEKLAIEVIADRIQHGELAPSALNVSFQVLSEQLASD
jgi:predicted RNase H-like HicB family nuclease